MPRKQSRKDRRRSRQIKAAKEYRAKLYARETEIMQPGCMSHTAAALKHHYYPKKMVNSIVSAVKVLNKSVKTLKRRSSKKKTRVHPKKGGYRCMTMKKRRKKHKGKTYKKHKKY